MPRSRSQTRGDLLQNAMLHFWKHGYEASSISDLVTASGVGQGAIYADYKDKRTLYAACLAHYRETTIGDAFRHLEAPDADLGSIELFIEGQLSALLSLGMPARGCMIGNAATERAPHDADIRTITRAHYDRLVAGFHAALMNETGGRTDLRPLALMTAVSFQGLAAFARICDDEDVLREQAATLVQTLRAAVAGK